MDGSWTDAWTALVARMEEQRESVDTPTQAGQIARWLGLEPTQELAEVIEAVADSGFQSALADDQIPFLIATYGIAVGKVYAETAT